MSDSLPPTPDTPTDNVDGTDETLPCPVCGRRNRPGELICSVCGTVLGDVGATRHISIGKKQPRPAGRPGSVFIPDQKPIVFQIGDQRLTLPLKETVVVGRGGGNPGAQQPDVDLSPFGAADQGVSRQHAKLTYKGDVVYVTDLGSSNGSWLNGSPLMANHERLLRDGDELRLGLLTIKVKF